MKKLQFILLAVACLSFTQNQFGALEWFETAIDDVGNALENTFVKPGDNFLQSINKLVNNISSSADSTSSNISDTAQSIHNAGQQVAAQVNKVVDESEKKINQIKGAVSNNLGTIQDRVNRNITPDINKLSAVLSDHSVTENIKVLKQSGTIIANKIEHLKNNIPSITLDNIATLDLNPFFVQINNVYEAIQKPLQAVTNVIHIMYTTLSYTSAISSSSGQICYNAKLIADAFNFPLMQAVFRIEDMVTSLKSLHTVLGTTLPETFNNVAGASQNMSTGFNNLYQNIGNTLQALQKQILALQKAAKSIHGFGGSIPGGPMSMHTIPNPPPSPPAPPISLPTTIGSNSNGTLPPPPPLPA